MRHHDALWISSLQEGQVAIAFAMCCMPTQGYHGDLMLWYHGQLENHYNLLAQEESILTLQQPIVTSASQEKLGWGPADCLADGLGERQEAEKRTSTFTPYNPGGGENNTSGGKRDDDPHHLEKERIVKHRM